ncbi:transporter [Planctomycetaceae bacterium SCGC AG-212-F19]|nr:transporter [Planctomycetaceae bacterium SCGC AG-212-F19]
MISRFCIDRPIFAAVLSLVIALTGLLTLLSLDVAQYPEITPPTVQVSCSYPGGNAAVVADTVAAPIEQQVNGVEGMLYMSSQSSNDGSYTLTVTFDLGTDMNTALVMVQNRAVLALPQLPGSVQRQGLTIRKKTPDLLLAVSLVSPDGRYDPLYLSNYATIHLKDELLRVAGVSDISYLGERDYSIRAWLDPQKLAAHGITAGDVASAIRAQSVAAAAGQVGGQPSGPGTAFQLPLDTLGRLTYPDDFGAIIVRVSPATNDAPAPGVLRLGDLARVEMGALNYSVDSTLDGMPSVALGVHQLPGSNALQVSAAVRAKMEELRTRFPDGFDYQIVYDTTPFVRESLRDLGWTLLQALGLVAVVVLLFLQDWRAALIPLVAVPVAILGTFVVMAALRYSINTISLFGLVLAVGIVVDDAIVVVENVGRWLDHGLAPRAAAHRAMEEVTGPIIAVAVALGAVFVPCAFIPGITGQFFRQFAVTIAASTFLSALNSLTLSPALAAVLLRPRTAHAAPVNRVAAPLGWFLDMFNRMFSAGTALYTRLVRGLLHFRITGLLGYAVLLGLTTLVLTKAPTGFIPPQDQGHFFISVELPDAASLERTRAVMAQVDRLTRAEQAVDHTLSISGLAMVLNADSSNCGTMIVILRPFAERRPAALHVNEVMARLRREFASEIKDAQVQVLGAPPVPGISLAGGFNLMVEDRAALGPTYLQQHAEVLAERLREDRTLLGVFSPFRANTPQLYLDIDRAKVESLGVELNDVDQALQTYLGSLYVNNFNAFGRYWQVNLMADGRFRRGADDIYQLQVRNRQGDMIPLGTLLRVRDSSGPVMIQRYNLYTAAPILGGVSFATSSGAAYAMIDAQARQTLPRTMQTEWTQLTFFEIRAGHTGLVGFALGVVFVFLALAALYESWTLPLAVILVLPLCVLSAVVGVLGGRMAVNLYVQIGFVVLVGLASKNAILIVEFARSHRATGRACAEAILEACRLRLRPIIMTSLALILGVVPLVFAEGAGAEMRRALGLTVFSGMIGVTLFGVFLTPLFFAVFNRAGDSRWFASLWSRRAFSVFLVGAGGMCAGLLLAELGGEKPVQAVLAGIALGAFLVLIVVYRRRHGRPQPLVRGRFAEHVGGPAS